MTVTSLNPAVSSAQTRELDRPNETAGSQLGPYRLLERLGEGGFGEVWLAEQREPVKRRVALKIVKLGMDTREVIARFEAERQALALMDHPHIARVFDAGATALGRPYFVMELVRGVAITAFCNQERLDTRARLQLFLQACAAIQHAHQKGIIHRDIKPSNVLAFLRDGEAAVKVIDFGIAKATSVQLTDKTLFTQQGEVIGTPAYMSPEQAGGSGLDIDTRTDVYALGALLYELLTGSPPFTQAELSKGFVEMLRIVRDVEPQRPSARISLQQGSARHDAVSPAQTRALASQLKGDLDWIVLKCLEKDRARRYDTPSALAADVQRHLSGEAVLAAPPGRAYRAMKFVRRHKGGVLAVAVIAIALIAGMAGTLWQAQRARLAEADARRRADEAELIAGFQREQFQTIDTQQMGADLRASILAAVAESERAQVETAIAGVNFTDVALASLDSQIFKRALLAIGEKFKGQPSIQASLLQTVAATLTDLGLYESAVGPQSEALAIRQRLFGRTSPETLESILGMGDLLFKQGKYELAEPLLREAVAGFRDTLGERHPSTLTATAALGWLLLWQGELAEAESSMRAALAGRRQLLGDTHPDTLSALDSLAGVLYKGGQYAVAEPLYQEALAGLRRLRGDTDPATLMTINNLAHVSIYLNKFDVAESLFREALAGQQRIMGSTHPTTLFVVHGMGMALQAQGKHEAAVVQFREAFETRRRVLGAAHPDTLESMLSVVTTLHALGSFEQAARLGAEAIEQAAGLPVNHHLDTRIRRQQARTLLALGRHAEAEKLALEVQGKCVAMAANCTRTIEFLAQLYEAWHAAEPGQGYDAKALVWREKLPQP